MVDLEGAAELSTDVITRRGRHARPRGRRDVRGSITGPLLGVTVAAVEFCAAIVATWSVSLAFAVGVGVVMVVSIVVAPGLVICAVFPGSFLIYRVGPGALGMSGADVLTFLGTLAAIPHVPWKSRAFRRILFAAIGYSAVVTVAVVGSFTIAGAVEVVHRFVMVIGCICIGAAVVRSGKVASALRALVVTAAVYSVVAVKDTLTHSLRPAYALGMQKNSTGTLLASTILVLFFAESELRWPRKVTVPFGVVLLAGLAATQSRGAGLALIGAFVIFLVRSTWQRRGRRLAKMAPFIVIVGVVIGALMLSSFQHQAKDHQGADYKFGSVGSREVTYTIAWNEIIKPHPLFGIGPKWFRRPGAPGGEPHNIVLDEMAGDGVFGLIAFVYLLWACLRAARSSDGKLAQAAYYVLLARIVADLFDIFWVAGPNTLPFLVVGLAVGAVSREEESADRVGSAPVDVAAIEPSIP